MSTIDIFNFPLFCSTLEHLIGALSCKQSSEKRRGSENCFDVICGSWKIKYLGYLCFYNTYDVLRIEKDESDIVNSLVYFISAYFSTDIFLPLRGSKRLDAMRPQQLWSFDYWNLPSDDNRCCFNKYRTEFTENVSGTCLSLLVAADVDLNPQIVSQTWEDVSLGCDGYS